MDIFQYKDMRKNHYKFTFPLQMSQPKLETPLEIENAIKSVKSGAAILSMVSYFEPFL